MKGKKVTAYPALKHDIENVGGVWQDRCVGGAVVDGYYFFLIFFISKKETKLLKFYFKVI